MQQQNFKLNSTNQKQNFKKFGLRLREYREKRGDSITFVAHAINVSRTYMSKLENGHEKPSTAVFSSLIRHYSISREEAIRLASLLYGDKAGLILLDYNSEKEVKEKMDDRKIKLQDQPQGVQVNLAADKVSILYTDSVFITSNPFGIVFNVAQFIDQKNQQIVARIGMSRDHAKALAEVLAKHLAMTMPAKNKQ